MRLLSFLLTVLAGVALFGAVPARAQSQVTNTAQLRWDGGAKPSNPVSIAIERQPVTLTTYRVDPGQPGGPALQPSQCQGSPMTAGLTASGGTGATLPGLSPTTEIHAGEPLVFKLRAPSANRDPAAIDTISVILTTTGGDRETLTAFETAPDSGEFLGSIATRRTPPAAVAGDCALSLGVGDRISIECRRTGNQTPIANAVVDVLLDPFGIAFDSEDGSPVSGARVTLVDAATGQPAPVYADDGATRYPSSIVTGQPVTDAVGATAQQPPGEYRFPLVPPGRYRLRVEPPQPYVAPSAATPAQLAGLSRGDSQPFAITGASYGEAFTLTGSGAVRVDIPLDRPAVAVALTKIASRGVAAPGDVVLYTVIARNPDGLHAKRGVTLTDRIPDEMRLRPDTIRVDGAPDAGAVVVAGDGRTVTVALGTIPAGGLRKVTYALAIRPDAAAGQAINRAVATDALGNTSRASAAIRIERATIAARMTIAGRVFAGGCDADPRTAKGVAGVRLMLEDGSFAITDSDGRYHFDAVLSGTHVVQGDPASLGAGGRFVDCIRSTRSAGSAISRFVDGQGGSVVTVNFNAVPGSAAVVDTRVPTPSSDRVASGAELDLFADGKADIAWLFPAADYNPRAPSTRIAIRHLPDQVVALFADGKPVDPVTFDGSRVDPTQRFAVSLWRGIPIGDGTTHFTAEIRRKDGGTLVTTIARDVTFVGTAARAEFLPAKSRLIADGAARPVLAVRITDRDGRPVHAGSVGDIGLSAPYETAQAIDADQARTLQGLGRAKPTWHVLGDDGIAYIELAPTGVSGSATLTFTFRDGDTKRVQTIDTWLEPGQRDWTIVGLAEGSVAQAGLAGRIEPGAGGELRADGRIAFYAKGRILGKWLLTLAYDSAKRREDQRLSGAIDPNAYYTVYADRAERRFDAASLRKVYVKLERRQFYALFGDFETGFGETQLGRYQRAATGLKSELAAGPVRASGFVASIATRHRRDEIQGNGLSGPYALASRDVLANSEQVSIEVRDRLRSERIVERRTLTRFVDYDIDYAAGTIRFSAPMLSRSSDLDPQFIIVDYELDRDGRGAINAGLRGRVDLLDGKLRLGATALRDDGDQGRTTLIAADLRARPARNVEVRAEVAYSRGTTPQGDRVAGAAWLVELENHRGALDLLVYARSQGADLGVGQQNTAERGRRKVGVDAKLKLSDKMSLTASAWSDTAIGGGANRRAARIRLDRRGKNTDVRLGLTHAGDTLATGTAARSTLVEAGATQRLFGNRLELDASLSLPLGKAASVDFPAQYRLGARFAVADAVTLAASYEIARGDGLEARTARVGLDLKPWAGAKLTTGLGSQNAGENGHRTFAAYGLAQSFDLGKHWSIDATLDGNRTLGGIEPTRVVNPAQPVASGGFVGSGRLVTEDFTAITAGVAYRSRRWAVTARGEYRFGALGDRAAVTLGAIRQLDEGSVTGGLATWSRVTTGPTTIGVTDLAWSGAFRPASSDVALFGKIEYRRDTVTGGVIGAPLAGGSALAVDGDARSARLVASISFDWAPFGRDAGGLYQRSNVGLFVGVRRVSERIDVYDLRGTTIMLGGDARLGLGKWLELGVAGSLRGDPAGGSFAYAAGPTIGVRPAPNMLMTIGWNFGGFVDRDFADARDTRAGAFAKLRLKFDQDSFAFLGLRRR